MRTVILNLKIHNNLLLRIVFSARKGIKGSFDAPVVELMKAAGAIHLAVSNVSGSPRIIRRLIVIIVYFLLRKYPEKM
jgi:hypothetical protein